MIFQFEMLSKSYGMKKLFNNIEASFTDTDRIGLIGVNGSGKSTLLKVVAGHDMPDTGQITAAKNARIVYLPQEPIFNEHATIVEAIFDSQDPIVKLIQAYEKAVGQLENDPEDMETAAEIQVLVQKLTQVDAWAYEREVKSVLHQLGIHNLNVTMGTLSGGMKKRVALAKALVLPADLLILDEPTNHLDATTIEWLEQFLRSRSGGLLMVTHDRYFLDRVVNRIFELDGGRLFSYNGHYSDFIEQKMERERRESQMAAKNEKLYIQELAWMRQGVEARRTKQQARIQRFETLEASRNANGSSEELVVDVAHSRLGKTTVELIDVSFSYDNQNQLPLFTHLDFTLLRDDRVGIVGPNGIGKTTLLKVLTGELRPSQGHVRIGQTVVVGYFRQETEELPLNIKAIEYIKSIAEFAKTKDGTSLSASQLMEKFLFTGEMQWAPIAKLSGGERKRLYLLGVLMGAPNILVLDEPTNDLDLTTLTVLESYLEEFPGAVITVSHDRYFLDKTCDRLLVMHGSGVLIHTGNFTDYREKYSDLVQAQTPVVQGTKNSLLEPAKVKGTQAIQASSEEEKRGVRKGKLSFNEQREFDGLDERIEGMMVQLEEIEEKIKALSHDYLALGPLVQEKEALELCLLESMERKEYLEEILMGKA